MNKMTNRYIVLLISSKVLQSDLVSQNVTSKYKLVLKQSP